MRYPTELKTLGDHIRKRRLDLGLLQRDVAQQLGVDADSVCHWEVGHSQPKTYLAPRVIDFLGYFPYARPSTFGGWLVMVRRALGFSRSRFAAELAVDECTVLSWERNKLQPTEALRIRIRTLFGYR